MKKYRYLIEEREIEGEQKLKRKGRAKTRQK